MHESMPERAAGGQQVLGAAADETNKRNKINVCSPELAVIYSRHRESGRRLCSDGSQGFFFCLFAGTALMAQTDRAVLRGVVKDSSGASVPTAHITVTEIQTNIQVRALISDANGNYEVPDLKPTTYRVKADAPGFRSFIAQDVLLDAGQVRRLEITLEVGTASESITVEAGAALIQTETGTISGELDTSQEVSGHALRGYLSLAICLDDHHAERPGQWLGDGVCGHLRPQQADLRL